ncbi:MAG: hypothetical protein R2873_05170 [Caldilineaceae bacterium]
MDVFARRDDPNLPAVLPSDVPGFRVIHIDAGPPRVIPNDDIAPFLDAFTAGVHAFAVKNTHQYDLIHSHYWLSGLVGIALQPCRVGCRWFTCTTHWVK